eukprot:SAG31_NODE_696_length_12754_cov_9.480759_4_plen_349_part_00
MCLKAKEYIRTRQQTDPAMPWSLHLSLWRPHPPWVCTAPFHKMYDPQSVRPFVRKASPAKESEVHPWLSWNTAATLPASQTDEATLRHMRSQYLGSVSEVDSQIGELFEFLKASGEWERTFIVLTADHGEQLGDHWQLGKLGFFRQSYQIPLIIRDPRHSADGGRGQRVSAVTEHIDVAPTLIEAMGGTVPPAMDGNSLLPFVEQGPTPPIGAHRYRLAHCRKSLTFSCLHWLASNAPVHVVWLSAWRTAGHYDYDFRSVTSRAVENVLGISFHECSLSVLHNFKYDGKYYKFVHFSAMQLPPLLYCLDDDPGEYLDLVHTGQNPQVVLVGLAAFARPHSAPPSIFAR